MIIQPTFVDPISPNPIDVSAYKLYQSLGPIRGIARVPIDSKMGINCGGETINSGGRRIDWDGFCVENWNGGWAVFTNIFIWSVFAFLLIFLVAKKIMKIKRIR